MATRYSLSIRALDVVGVAGVVTVTCQLCDSYHDPVVGYTDDGEIVDRFSGYTDSDGELTLSLVANSAITPANTYYSLRIGSRRFLIEKGTSTQTVQQALAGSPAELASALALDQLSDVHAPAPSNGQALLYDSGDARWEAADVATQAELDTVSAVATAASTGLASHLADTVDAHDAAAISVTPTGGIAATDVQAALAELDTDKATATALADHLSDPVDAHDATAVSFTPTGGIAATDAQAALVELDTDKVAKAGDTMTGPLVLSDDGGGKLQFAPSIGGTPDVELHHAGIARTLLYHALTTGQFNLVWQSYGGTPLVALSRANGTSAAPTQALSGDILGSFYFFGANESGVGAPAGAIHVKALENITSTANGSEIGMFTKAVGSTNFNENFRLRSTQVDFFPDGSTPLRVSADGYIEGVEIVDPAAPDANKGRLYLRDNAGATELCARFASGDVRVLASSAGQTATTDQPGTVELATTAETETGIDAARVPSVAAAQATYVKRSLVDAKGDLIVATADNTPARLAVGADGAALVANANAAAGVSWARPVSALNRTGYYSSPVSARLSIGVTDDRLTFLPFVVARRAAFDRAAVDHSSTVASAGSVCRFGVWANDGAAGQDVPGTLIQEFGTVPLDSAAAFKALTIALTLDPGLYWLGAVAQLTGGSANMASSAGPIAPHVPAADATGSGATCYASSVSGSLASNPSLAVGTTSGIIVWLRSA